MGRWQKDLQPSTEKIAQRSEVHDAFLGTTSLRGEAHGDLRIGREIHEARRQRAGRVVLADSHVAVVRKLLLEKQLAEFRHRTREQQSLTIRLSVQLPRPPERRR